MKARLARRANTEHSCVMRIPNEALDELIELYRQEFGAEIGRDEANEIASRLVVLYDRLTKNRPMPLDDPPHSPIGFHT